jgi:hypothetical protein
MTQDEIIEMAKKVYGDTNWTEASLSRLECFAKLAVADEREACAKLCETDGIGAKYQGDVYAQAIRARGQA